MATREGTFYGIWPVLDGKPLNLQWGEIRSNQAELKAIVRNSEQELEDGVDELNALRSLLGQAYGDLTFRNKFRFHYNKVTLELCCQKNDGTVDVPIWTDAWCVRFVDGQFQVVSQGGMQSEAGFYGPGLQSIEEVAESSTSADVSIRNPTKIFFNSDDGLQVVPIASGANEGQPEIRFSQPFGKAQQFLKTGRVWQVDHNFGVSPVMVQIMDGDDRIVIPDMADVSDPNTAWFYFDNVFKGSVYIASGGIGAASLVPRDPFYLTVRHDGQPARPENTFSPNADMIFDQKWFYINPDQDEIAGGAHPKVRISLTDEATNPGITFTDGDNIYASADRVNFNGDHFYLSSNLEGEPVVNLEPKALLIVEEADGTPSTSDVEKIIFSNGTVTDNGDGTVTVLNTGVSNLEVTDAVNTYSAVAVLNLSDADFYLSSDLSGEPVVNLLGGGTDLTVTDGVNTYLQVAQQNYNGSNFYLSSDLSGNPVVNFIPEATAFIHTQSVAAVEWIVNHNTDSELVVAQAYDDADRQIVPDVIDASDPNTTYFYFVSDQAGKAVISSVGAPAAVGSHSSLANLNADDHTQYSRTDGTRVFTGDVDFGNNDLLNIAQIPGPLGVGQQVTAESFYVSAGGGGQMRVSGNSLFIHANVGIGDVVVDDSLQVTGTIDPQGGFNNFLRGPAGGASTPSFSFTADTDTGMYRVAADTLGFSANGSHVATFGRDGLTVEDKVRAEAFYFESGGEAPQSYVEEFSSSQEWIVNHNLDRPHFIAQSWRDNDKLVIPDQIDVSNVNIAYFYFAEAMAGKAVILAVG